MFGTSLHEPILDKSDFNNLKKSFSSGWISGGGKFTIQFENLLKKKIKAKNLTTIINCSSALQISLRLAGVKNGHEVIVPTVTFISTINSIIYNNAKPIFMDIDEYFNLDKEKTIEFIQKHTFYKNGKTFNKKTKNIISCLIIVHTFGNAAKIDDLYKLCKKRNIKIIEDAAESLGTKYIKGKFKDKFTSTVGFIGCISFNGNKIITSGGGGAIISSSKRLIKKAKHLINQSKTDPINFMHDEVGYNMKISNLHASIGCSQLKKLQKFITIKKKIHEYYKKKINKINGLKILEVPSYSNNNYWLNVLEIDPSVYKKSKKQVIKKLIINKINARSVWYPNHLQKPFKHFQNFKIYNAKIKVENSICLPSSVNLNKNKINYICKILNA